MREDVNSGEKIGARVALLFQPNENVSITPRIVYQKLETDGYPRIDHYNILGNPFTTTQPAVNPGERGQVTQIPRRHRRRVHARGSAHGIRPRRRDADLGHLVHGSRRGRAARCEPADRQRQLRAFGVVPTSAEVRLNSPLYRHDCSCKAFSQEVRLASDGGGAFEWLVGAFYQDIDREYGQNLPTPGYDALLTRAACRRAPASTRRRTRRTSRRCRINFKQFALFGEGTYHFTDQWSLTGGLRYYDFDEDRMLTFAGVFADVRLHGPAGLDQLRRFLAARDSRLRAERRRAADGAGRARLPARRHQRSAQRRLCTPQDLAIFSGQPTFEDEKVTNYELGAKTQFADGRVTFNAAVFYSRHRRSAGDRGRRLVLLAHRAQRAGRVGRRRSSSCSRGRTTTGTSACRRPGCRPRSPSRSSTSGGAADRAASATAIACRPRRSSRRRRASTYTLAVLGDAGRRSRNFTFQHVGSSYTQLADQEPARSGCVGCPRRSGLLRPSATRRSPASRSTRSCRPTRSAICASA